MRGSTCQIVSEEEKTRYGNIKVIGKHKPKPIIGKFVSIASGVSWIAVGHHTKRISTFPFHLLGIKDNKHPKYFNTLDIGNDVYIGSNVTFIGDIRVYDGAVIGANSVVRQSIPAFSIVFGNPAQIIKYRFDKVDIEILQTIRWWDWSLEEIKEKSDLILNGDSLDLYHYFLERNL